MNYISKYYTIALIINNTKVYDHIISNKASKGRYIDYTIRRLIKSTFEELIKDKKIDPHKNVRLIINIDEQSTKSNGYYNLKDGLTEELLHGISNFNYEWMLNIIFFNFIFHFLSFVLLGPHLRHVEVPRLGV